MPRTVCRRSTEVMSAFMNAYLRHRAGTTARLRNPSQEGPSSRMHKAPHSPASGYERETNQENQAEDLCVTHHQDCKRDFGSKVGTRANSSKTRVDKRSVWP
jgi:hypothetical protein